MNKQPVSARSEHGSSLRKAALDASELSNKAALPLIFGVLNVTPDSFSDGGKYFDHPDAILRGRELHAQGAQIIDIGGESTRPGALPVSVEDELDRVLPVISALATEGITVSIDTIHAATARRAVAAGATIINDVSGGAADPEMYSVVRDTGAIYVMGHWRGIPDAAQKRSHFSNVTAEVRDALAALGSAAQAAGVHAHQIVIDPGLGFDKTADQGWALLAQLVELKTLGYPVLVGISRKRMLTELLDTLPATAARGNGAADDPRDLMTAVTSAMMVAAGAWGVRVHNVAATAQALAVAKKFELPQYVAHDDATVSAPTLPEASGPVASLSQQSEVPVDRITLTGLEVFAHHGVFDFERAAGQRFLIDAEVAIFMQQASGTDDLGHTVHYGELAEAIVAAVQRDPVDLIETVAERVAQVALGFAGVAQARITVHKPQAPITVPFGDVSVTVVRSPAPSSTSVRGEHSAVAASPAGGAQ